jgi:hypothetical protein
VLSSKQRKPRATTRRERERAEEGKREREPTRETLRTSSSLLTLRSLRYKKERERERE